MTTENFDEEKKITYSNVKEVTVPAANQTKEIASLKQMTGNQNNNLGGIEDRLKQSEDQIKHIDGIIVGLDKAVAICKGAHVETVEKMKEVTVLASNNQVQVKEQEQKG